MFGENDPIEQPVPDSTAATLTHIRKVNHNIIDFCMEMLKRAQYHDESKLHEPEKSILDQYTPTLYGSAYMSEEYKATLLKMKPMLDHHEANNSHHPGYYQLGINGMNLFDLIEFFCDSWAASERNPNGSFLDSLNINRKRFNFSDQLYGIFVNTYADWSNKKAGHIISQQDRKAERHKS